MDIKDIDWSKAVEGPTRTIEVKPRARTAFRPVPAMTKTWCVCKRWLLREGEAVCWECKSESTQRAEFIAAVTPLMTREEALAELRALEGVDPEQAHYAAEIILLQLLQDEEVAAAFYAVPKWYA